MKFNNCIRSLSFALALLTGTFCKGEIQLDFLTNNMLTQQPHQLTISNFKSKLLNNRYTEYCSKALNIIDAVLRDTTIRNSLNDSVYIEMTFTPSGNLDRLCHKCKRTDAEIGVAVQFTPEGLVKSSGKYMPISMNCSELIINQGESNHLGTYILYSNKVGFWTYLEESTQTYQVVLHE